MTQIRAIHPEELKWIPPLIPDRDELFRVYPAGHYPFTHEQVQQLYSDRFEFTVICEDNNIVGFANLYDCIQGQYAFIGNLFIAPDYRGHGLGTVLLQYMIKAAFEKYRLPEVRLSVFADNTNALALYTRFGFRVYDNEERVDPQGSTVKLLHMKLAKSDVT
ncbi:MAG: GNAT family N-acetyltransferase [Gammaproteobacteria bacterium]|jgi:ribosomal protein S18 acetylase RimI-like enzyme